MITRFGPSPTGPLHLGHAYAAMVAHDMARAAGGAFLLRIEDIDDQRSKPEWEQQILNDLCWLGLTWDGPIVRQSQRLSVYRDALKRLWALGLLYPCTCSRKDIQAALDAPQEGGHPIGPDGVVYPGTCRDRGKRTGAIPKGQAIRLDMKKALDWLQMSDIRFLETALPNAKTSKRRAELSEGIGDIVLSRRDFPGSYHLSVVLDDAAQSVTHVTRGADLFDATFIHVLLQKLLDLETPIYHHHRLIRDTAGKRLAKRDDARALSKYRAEGATPADIRCLVELSDN